MHWQDILQNLIYWEDFRFLIYWVLFVASAMEALPFVGLIVPGTTLLLIFGFLSSQKYADLGDLMILAVGGAIIGDVLAYHLGIKYGVKFFKDSARLFKPQHLIKAEGYFHRHGGKSVFWGRFIGPIRPFVAFMAGMGKMNYNKFLFFNITSAVLWGATYLFLGFFFGEHWRRIAFWFDRLGIGISLVLIIGLLIVYIARRRYEE